MSLLDLFCSVDAFWQWCALAWEREVPAPGQRRLTLLADLPGLGLGALTH